MSYENNRGDHIIHALATDGPNELQQCILLGASYVQRVVQSLNDRFPDLLVLSTTNLFNPRNYPNDDNDQITNTKLWLERILMRFHYTKEESDMCKQKTLGNYENTST